MCWLYCTGNRIQAGHVHCTSWHCAIWKLVSCHLPFAAGASAWFSSDFYVTWCFAFLHIIRTFDVIKSDRCVMPVVDEGSISLFLMYKSAKLKRWKIRYGIIIQKDLRSHEVVSKLEIWKNSNRKKISTTSTTIFRKNTYNLCSL